MTKPVNFVKLEYGLGEEITKKRLEELAKGFHGRVLDLQGRGESVEEVYIEYSRWKTRPLTVYHVNGTTMSIDIENINSPVKIWGDFDKIAENLSIYSNLIGCNLGYLGGKDIVRK